MHKIESSLSTRAGAARGRRGVRAWLRNRAAVPATSPAPVSTPINPTVRVGSERGGAIVPTCPRRPRPSARSERHPRRGVDEKMQKRERNDAVSLSREINTFTYEPARLATWGAAVGRKCRNLYIDFYLDRAFGHCGIGIAHCHSLIGISHHHQRIIYN